MGSSGASMTSIVVASFCRVSRAETIPSPKATCRAVASSVGGGISLWLAEPLRHTNLCQLTQDPSPKTAQDTSRRASRDATNCEGFLIICGNFPISKLMTSHYSASQLTRLRSLRVALMLPCLNEELTLERVIRDFRAEIPHLEVYVFDNNSTDRSVEIAHGEAARVIRVSRRGKGHVVRKMFEAVEADIYIMVDSDDTYDAKGIHALIKPLLEEEADMVVGSRLQDHSLKAFRKFHRLGNALIIGLINFIFGSQLTDICSGYRVMSRQFVKNIPFMRDGFEIETELTVYSLIYGFAIKEIPLAYRHRPPNSHSKLRTFSDGYKVLLTIVWLARDLRPLLFFAAAGLFLFAGVMLPIYYFAPQLTLIQNILAMLSVSLVMTGVILNSVHIRFQEIQVLARRNQPASETLVASQRRESLTPERSAPLREVSL